MRHAEYSLGEDRGSAQRCAWDNEPWPCKGEQLRRASVDIRPTWRDGER